jgi:hypothetical protein
VVNILTIPMLILPRADYLSTSSSRKEMT